MKKNVLLIIFGCILFSGPLLGQRVQHTYRFYRNLTVAQPECGPNLSQTQALGGCTAAPTPGDYVEDVLPCGARRIVYHNNLNWGLAYPNDEGAITDTYTIQMYVKVTDWGRTWARIIDFSNGQLDDGIYFKDKSGSEEKCLDFYPNGVVGECPFFNKSTYYLLTFTRNGTTGIMDVYVDNRLFASYNDAQGRYVGRAGVPIFIFRDDEKKTCESGAANFAYLSFNNQYISKTEVEKSFTDICFIANINAYADFSISPNPSCGFPKNITVTYTGTIPAPGADYDFNWEWDGARVISGSGMGPYVVSWDSGGSKNVALTVSSKQCGNPLYNRKQAVISNLDLNTTVASGSCETGSDGTLTLRGIGGMKPYQFSLDSVNYQSDSVFTLAVGDYRVYIKDQNNCTVAKSTQVRFTSDITVATIPDTVVCDGGSVSLVTESNAEKFSWLPANTLDDPLAKNPLAAPGETTQYIVTASRGFCTQTDTVNVEVLPKVEVRVTPDATIIYNVPFQLHAASPQIRDNDASFRWSPATGLNDPLIQSPIATLQENQAYTVEVTSDRGCTGSGQVSLTILREESIVLPGAFTPDGDGRNEIFTPILHEIVSIKYFRIYNRWGELVFFTDQMNTGWNGSYQGNGPVGGVYEWEIEGSSVKGKKIAKKGSVILIK